MTNVAQVEVVAAREVAEKSRVASAANGLRYGAFGELRIGAEDLLHILEAVPGGIVQAIGSRVYCFVPLTLAEEADSGGNEKANRIQVATGYTASLADQATCHRDVEVNGTEYTFISSRLMQDRFALAFELFINVAHQLVDAAGVPGSFADLALAQQVADVRGETSLDAFEYRRQASGSQHDLPLQMPGRRGRSMEDSSAMPVPRLTPEEAKQSFLESACADALAIYMLSLSMDFDYADLREREYPLLAAPALADRLRLLARLFPAGPGYEFSIRYRRRS